MQIGIPKEIKTEEHRVAMPPSGVREFDKRGHSVFIEVGAGEGSGFYDHEYETAGATLLESAADVWSRADMIIKVKEPQSSELAFLRPNLILFTYLHLAAEEELTNALLQSGVTGIAYETVADSLGRLPLLEPMSEVAGRMASQVVSHYLERHKGGRGVLMGGVPGVAAATHLLEAAVPTRNDYDPPVAVQLHQGSQCLADAQGAVQVRLYGLAEGVGADGKRGEALVQKDGRVVHQNVQPPELGFEKYGELFGGVLLGYVERMKTDVMAVSL